MEITIKTRCPHCKREIDIDEKNNTQPEKKETGSLITYYIGRESSLKTYKQPAWPDDRLKDFIESLDKTKNKTAVNHVKDYFLRLSNEARVTNDPRKLLDLSRKIVKMKVKVSKKLSKEFEKNKKELIKIIGNKFRLLKK